MERVLAVGLSLEVTGAGSEREMQTIRYQGNHVASISFYAQTDQEDIRKSGFWVQFIKRKGLSSEQITSIEKYLRQETARGNIFIFGGQQ